MVTPALLEAPCRHPMPWGPRAASILGTALACLGLAASSPQGTVAQTGFALRGGSLGPGIEVSHQFFSKVAVRAGGTYLPLNGLDFTVEDETVDVGFTVDAKLRSVYVLADFMPIGGFIHLSAGLVYNAVQVDGAGKPLQDYQLEARTFSKDQIGSVGVSLSYATKIAPYVGIGLVNVASGGTLGFTIDGGVIFSGPLTVDFTATGMLEPTGEQDDVIQEALDGVKIYPVISLGLVIRP